MEEYGWGWGVERIWYSFFGGGGRIGDVPVWILMSFFFFFLSQTLGVLVCFLDQMPEV